MPQGPFVGYNTAWVNGGPCVLGLVPQRHSHSFHIQKGKRESGHWDAQGQVDSPNSPLGP